MKSKILQNSKGLISRSFNPSKCKTSLRLAGSRLKLLRNKKEVQVKQMKKEIAQLLESGQDQTARIRVEHVIREEKLMAAYDLLEIYCELIVARLPIIESQKDCPIDLKEAIASVVFASPRCGDVPELLDVRKHFSSKYGKEFTTAAIELRPQCGVGRLLVEKLSAVAPDGQTKIKILSAIAEEHNVKWDNKLSDEKESGGPSSIRKENELHAEPPRFEAAAVQSHPSNKVQGSPLNFAQQDAGISLGAEKLSSGQTSSVSTRLQPEARPSGDKVSQLFQGDLDGPRWNMEFTDAASAAQAAAESAELASMAARAAAELSSHGRILTPHSTESHNSAIYSSKDGLEAAPNLNSSEKKSEASMNISSSARAGLENAQTVGIKPSNLVTSSRLEEGGGGSEEYRQSASLKAKASVDDDFLNHDVPFVEEHEVSVDETNMTKQSFSHEAETPIGRFEKAENLGKGKIVKQKSLSSSCSQSSIPDDVNIFASFEDQKFEHNAATIHNFENPKFDNDAGENPFVGISETGFREEAPQTSSHESAAVFFDKSDSDSEDNGPERGPIYDEQDLEFPSPTSDKISPEPLSMNTDSWSPRSSFSKQVPSSSPSLFFTREQSSPDFSENTTLRDDAEQNFAPLTFDDSDGPTSESDLDMNDNKVEDSRKLLHEHSERGQSVRSEFGDETGQSVGSPFKDERYSEIESNQLSLSSDDEGMHWKRKQDIITDADSSDKFSPFEPSSKQQAALGSEDSQMELGDVGNESSQESGERLNLGKLTGGFRHKKHNHLPVFKNRLDASSSGKKEAETTSSPSPVEHSNVGTIPQPKKGLTTPSKLDSDSSDEEELLQKKSSREQSLSATKPVKTLGASNSIFGSDDSDSDEEDFLPKKSSHKQSVSVTKPVKTKSTLGASNSIFGSDESDLDVDYHSPKESLTKKTHLRSGLSRRTKATPSSNRTNTKSDTDGVDRKPTTSYNSEASKGSGAHGRNSGKRETSEQPILASTPAKSNLSGSTEQPDSAKETYVTTQQSKKWNKFEAKSSDVSLGKKPLNSDQMENSEPRRPVEVVSVPTNSSSSGTPEKPNSGKATKTMQESQSSSAVEEKPSPQQKSDTSIGSENHKTASSNNDDGAKKASHVHPKLPDYDSLVQSLRKNRS